MKNIVIVSLSIVISFMAVSCNKVDVSKLAGTYTGTLTSADVVKEDVQLTFSTVFDRKTLSLFNVELEKTSENNKFNADASVILEMIHLIDADITEDIVTNASAVFVFEDEEVTMDMKYSISHKMNNTVNVRYIGKK